MQHLIIEDHHDILATLYGVPQPIRFLFVELEGRPSAIMCQANRLASAHAAC